MGQSGRDDEEQEAESKQVKLHGTGKSEREGKSGKEKKNRGSENLLYCVLCNRDEKRFKKKPPAKRESAEGDDGGMRTIVICVKLTCSATKLQRMYKE
jgi:hypothetical protein